MKTPRRIKNPLFLLPIILTGGLLWLFVPKNQNEKAIPAIYFWESNQAYLEPKEELFIKENKLQKLYVKFFEVDYNPFSGNYPLSKTELNVDNTSFTNMEIIPTIFIRNAVFKEISKAKMMELVENVLFLVEKRFSENFKKRTFKELQIDCDWTISTKENYHAFLTLLKQKLGSKTLSATLRLYPYKFPDKMGVLPVDKAMLMCYNLISPLEAGNRNSILDLAELQKYLDGAEEYPIPLDIALPTFSAAHVYKNQQFYRIINTNVNDLTSVTKKLNSNWSIVLKDTIVEQVFLRKGDRLKMDRISPLRLKKMIQIVSKYVVFDETPVVALFYLDENQLKSYSHESISATYASFNH